METSEGDRWTDPTGRLPDCNGPKQIGHRVSGFPPDWHHINCSFCSPAVRENTLQVELSETQVTRRTTRGQNPQLEGKNLQNKTTREPSLQNKIIQEQSQWSSRCKGQNQRPRGHHCKNNRTWRTRQKETRSVRPKPAQQRTEWQNQQLEDRTWNNWSEVGEQSQWSSGCGGQNQTSGQHHRRTRRQNLRDRTTGELNQWSRRTIWQNMQNQKSQNNTTQLLNSRMNGTKWTWRM